MRLFKQLRILMFTAFAACLSHSLFAMSDGDLPSSWDSESAVIANQESDFFYIPTNKGKEISTVHNERLNIVINNEKGAEDFKFIYLPKGYNVEVSVEGESRSDDYDQYDGKDIAFGEELPYFFEQMFQNFSSFEKINLGSLEKGDEISINYSFENSESLKAFMNGQSCKAFPSQTITFPTIYPKGSHIVTVKLGGQMFFNYGAQNGGPSASLESRLEADTTVFVLKGGQSEAIAEQYFAYPAMIYATSKFEVAVCPKYKAEAATLLLGNVGESNEMWEESQIKTIAFNKVKNWSQYAKMSKGLLEFLGEVKIKGTDDLLKQYYRGFQSYVYNTGEVENYTPEMFMGVMASVFDANEIAYDIILGVDRRTGNLDEMILNNELVYGFRVKDKRDDYFYFPFSKYSTWTDLDFRLLGAEVFAFTPAKKMDDSAIDVFEMSESLPAANQMVVREKLKLGDGFTAVIVNKNISYKGTYKTEMAPKIITVPEYHKAMFDRKVYANYADFRDEDEAEDMKENRVKYFEGKVRSVMDTVEFQKFNVKNTGFEEDEDWLQVNEKFTIPGDDAVKFQIKDSMRVYTVSVGKFIVSNYKITSESYKREGDIYVDYPKIVDYTLRFDIPQGYAMFGFDDFETDLDADFASYKCTAKVEPGELKVSATLVIKKARLSEDEWQQLASILNKFQETAKVQVTLAGN
ncbi:MAG: hypothetical protein JXQ87_02045 [Bacteroidia bacterium]